MSSVVVSTSAALGRPFLFDAESKAEECPLQAELKKPARHTSSSESVIASVSQSKIGNRQSAISLTPASRLEARPAPEMVTSGIAELDALIGGLPRGCLTEICGTASSGRTSVMLAALAAATRRGEYCALIDASDALDPLSIAATDIDLDRLLWVRCSDSSPRQQNSPRRHRGTENQIANHEFLRIRTTLINNRESTTNDFSVSQCLRGKKSDESEQRLEQVLRATDLLLESGGFGLIVLDLGDVPPQAARRIPLTTWFRFRRAVEHKPTMLFVLEQQPIAGSCSSLLLRLGVISTQYSVLSSCLSGDVEPSASQISELSHAQLLTGLEINIELTRSRLERKPAQSVMFETQAAWAG